MVCNYIIYLLNNKLVYAKSLSRAERSEGTVDILPNLRCHFKIFGTNDNSIGISKLKIGSKVKYVEKFKQFIYKYF